jgi:hypothetical protein
MNTNIIYDRTFDASCMKRAGEDEWAEKIIARLKANHPEFTAQIDTLYNGYLSFPMADYIKCRMDYMLEHRDTIKLRYK